LNGDISNVKIYNTALTATEVKELYSGASVPFKYKGPDPSATITNTENMSWEGADGSRWNADSGTWVLDQSDYSPHGGGDTSLKCTAGGRMRRSVLPTLTVGKAYRLTCRIYKGSEDGTQAVAVMHAGTGVGSTAYGSVTADSSEETWTLYSIEFVATQTALYFGMTTSGTISTGVWMDDWDLNLIGAVAEYDGSGIAADKWFDKSGNDFHGTVSGATVENAPSGDDGLVYEEGTFTLATTGHTGTLTVNTSYDTLLYTRIGRVVHCQGNIRFSAASGHSGNLVFTGLPFTSVSGTAEESEYPSVTAYIENMVSAIDGYVSGLVEAGATTFSLREGGLTGDGSDLVNHIDTGTYIKFQITYFV
jgi:hypothetical protein